MKNYVDKNALQEFATKLNEKQKTIFATKSVEISVDNLENDIATLQAAVGSPLVASLVADMTDTEKIYVYVGSETGYTAGNWYYYDGSAWTSGGVYNAVALETDKTLSIAGAAADAKAAGDSLSDLADTLSSIINFEPIKIEEKFTAGNGINSSGNIFSSSKRIATEGFIDVSAARKTPTEVLGNANKPCITYNITEGYRLFVAYYNNASVEDFVSTQGWLTGSGKLTPTGNYMRVCYASVGDASTLTVEDADKIQLNIVDSIQAVVSYLNNYGLTYKGHLKASSDLNDIKSIGVYSSKTNSGGAPSHVPSGSNGGTLFVIPTRSQISNGSSFILQLIQIYVAVDGSQIWLRYASESSALEWRDWVALIPPVQTKLIQIVEQTKWLALGDSITYGVYSDGSGSHDSTNGWVKRLADSLDFDLTNMGVRGMGYIASGGNNIHFSDVLTEVEALTDSFNLVTVALGINDYNTSSVSLASLETVIKDSIERLATKFPEARLVYITPFNSNRRGDATTKYCYNYAYSSRSLKDIADLIKQCCDTYGVECIYASDGFLMNTKNMATLLPDQTHPSNYAHTLIAKNMAHLLLN